MYALHHAALPYMGTVLCKLVAYCILILHAFRAYLSRASIRDHVGRLLVLGYYTSSQLILTFPSFRAYTIRAYILKAGGVL